MGALTLGLSQLEVLTETHGLSEFSCGKPALDRWLKSRALTNQQRGFTAVVVIHVDMRVVGFYGLAPASVIPALLPRSIRTGQPPDPVPCLLLGQLATDSAWAGKGIAIGLLAHALHRCVAAAKLVGGRALIVNAVDAEAAAFWARRGFLPTKDNPNLLVRSMIQIEASLAAASS